MSSTRQSAACAASAARAVSAEWNTMGVKPPTHKIRSMAWLMLGSSSTTTILGALLGICIYLTRGGRSTRVEVRASDALASHEMGAIIGAGKCRRNCTLGKIRLPFGAGGHVSSTSAERPILPRRGDCLELIGEVDQLGEGRDAH